MSHPLGLLIVFILALFALLLVSSAVADSESGGSKERSRQTGMPKYSGEMKNLVKFTKIQKYDGVLTKWEFVFWKPWMNSALTI